MQRVSWGSPQIYPNLHFRYLFVHYNLCRLWCRHLVFKIPLCKRLEFFVRKSLLLRPFRKERAKPPRLASALPP